MSTDQSSMGPALVGNISVDSLDNDTSQLQQQHQQEQHHQPNQNGTPLELTFDATSSPVPGVGPQHTGGDTSLFEHDTDVSVGPTIREAEEYADQMTSEILEQVQAVSEKEQEVKSEPQEEPQEQQQQQQEQQQQQPPPPPQQQPNNEEVGEKVDFKELKVERVEEEQSEVRREPRQLQLQEEQTHEVKEEEADEDDEKHHHYHHLQDDHSISLIKLNDSITNNELFHQTFKTAANTSQIADDKSIMEFTKNYSDDLMGSSDGQNRGGTGGPDLADFELPPYSGSSSSGSEQAAATTKHSPVKQRKSSNSMATQASSSYGPRSGVGAAPDLSAVKNILISTYSNVAHIFHWKRPIESGVVFTIGLMLITALTFFSIISVVAYTALGCILTSGVIRIYKTSMKTLNRSPETPVDHIWERVLSIDVSMSPERLHELVETSHANLNASLIYFKQVLLVEDKIATTKSFLFLYSLTYIGSWFNGMTLITMIYLALFSVPKLYESNKTKIDECLNVASKQLSTAMDSVTNKFGGSSKKQN